MPYGKEIRSRFFARNPIFNYLPDQDRYLFAIDPPKFRFNVIGAGLNGQEHIRVTMLESRATINGIYDPNQRSIEGAQRTYQQFIPNGQLVVYDSLEAACNDPTVDGLIIATPNYSHIDLVRSAVKSGKHILLEKPMATSIPDAYEIMRLAEGYPAVFQIGLQYRYKAIYVEAIHEALQRSSLGAIKTINITEHRMPFLDKVKQWNKFSRFSGGTLVEKCCHYFDLLNHFAQARPVSVYATGGMAVNFIQFEYDGERSDILDHAFVSVVYDNGVRASFNLCMFAPMFYEELVLCGEEGRLRAFEQEDYLPEAHPRTGLEIYRGEHQPSRMSTPNYPHFIEATGHNGATFYEHVNFINNIEGLPTNTASALEGFWAIVVGVAAEESIKHNRVIHIDQLLAEQGLDTVEETTC